MAKKIKKQTIIILTIIGLIISTFTGYAFAITPIGESIVYNFNDLASCEARRNQDSEADYACILPCILVEQKHLTCQGIDQSKVGKKYIYFSNYDYACISPSLPSDEKSEMDCFYNNKNDNQCKTSRCGDKVCDAEQVCSGGSCYCGETTASCPQDYNSGQKCEDIIKTCDDGSLMNACQDCPSSKKEGTLDIQKGVLVGLGTFITLMASSFAVIAVKNKRR